MNQLLVRDQISKLLAQKRNYQQEIKHLTQKYQYVVFYGCGAILNSIVETWNVYIDRKIDFCCDSDSAKWGKYFCGVRCLSPAELVNIKDQCVIFVTIGDFKDVYNNLIENQFPSVHLIYKYDLVTSDFLSQNNQDEILEKLCQTYNLLADQKSRNVFEAIINRTMSDSRNPDIMADVAEKNQYFPSDIITLSKDECFVDCGAYDGDTVKDFITRTDNHFDKIYCFEVDAANYALLQAYITKMLNCEKIIIFNVGLWDSECDITYSIGHSQSTVGEGTAKGHVAPLDDILKNERVSFIKMDIEGAESRALIGARNIISFQKPKLAICVYHDIKHLWEVPLYLKELVPEYKIYLRHHTTLEYETVCYAVL